jgi:cytochrome c553
MKDQTKTIIFITLFGLPVVVLTFIFGMYAFGCATTDSCTGIEKPVVTPIPTLIAATMPAPKVGAEAGPLVARCQVSAVDLIGAWVEAGYPETDAFQFVDQKDQTCTATFAGDVQKLFNEANLWYSGAAACTTCHYADVTKANMGLDMSSYAGILAGSQRMDGSPKGNDILAGGDWESSLLYQMVYAPDGQSTIGRQIMPLGRPATVPAEGPVIFAGTPVEVSGTGE